MRIGIGIFLAALGILATLGFLPGIGWLSYPLVWWGVLVLMDELNFRRHGDSPMKSIWFWAMLVPASVLYWLFFEYLNVFFPQWVYAGEPDNSFLRMLLAVSSYGTVIPIVVETMWLGHGPIRLPQGLKERERGIWAPISVLIGLQFALLPVVSQNFWLNQLMWLSPLFLVLPFIVPPGEKTERIRLPHFLYAGAIAGLVSGVLWEFFNYRAGAKWTYLIFPDMFRLFEMPVLGYLGFIPFAWSTLAIYLWLRRSTAGWWPYAWGGAIAAAWLFAATIS